MRKLSVLILIATLYFLQGCNSSKAKVKNVWSDTDRNAYMKDCTRSAAAFGDSARNYCECLLEMLQVKYPKFENVGKLTPAETGELAKECLK